ncbi:MAG TPA: VCBS domain-containing protein, partial [Candidatus Limnocylindrales bacterium]
MAEMTFTINDQSTGGGTPVVQVHIRENADGTVTIRLTQLVSAMNYLGDLRGFFMDLANESLLGTLNVSGSMLTLANGSVVSTTSAWTSGNDSVSTVGSNSNNMNGLLGTDRGFDFGIEIGTEGVGSKGDDVRAFEFTLGSTSRPLTLADFANVNFGVRIMSVGLDTNGDGVIDTARTGSVKVLEQGAATTGPNATVYVDDDVFNGGAGGIGDKADAEATTGILSHTYASGTVMLTAVDFPVGLGLSVVTLTPTLIVIAQNGTNVLEIKITNAATGAYQVTQLAPMLHPTGGDENDIPFTVHYEAVSSDGDTASGVLSINVNDDSVLFLATSDLDGSVTENGTLVATGHVDFKAADGATAVVDGSQTTLTYVPDGGSPEPLPAGLDADAIKAAFSITNAATGTWSFDASALDLDPLAKDDTITLTYKVVVTDADGDSATETVTIAISGTNDAPVAVADDNGGDPVVEAGVVAGDASASGNVLANDTDVDTGATRTVLAVNGSAANVGTAVAGTYGSVTINADGSYSYTLDNGDPDTDALAAGASVSDVFTYTVTDEHGATSSTSLTIAISGTNDAPVITSDGGGDTASVSVAENTTAVTTVTATDPDTGAVLTFSISGGADSALFQIDPNSGALSFISAPDFENPQDAGADNVYDVEVTASDGSAVDTQSIAVTVTNANEAPTITSNGGGDNAGVSVAENTIAVTTVVATDVDAATTITYSIAGGADAAKFTIDPNTGALTFVAAPNFEAPADVGGNNVYDVVVQASDGSLVDTQAIAVTVTDVNAAPTITSNGGGAAASVNVAENTTAVTTVVATDDGENSN